MKKLVLLFSLLVASAYADLNYTNINKTTVSPVLGTDTVLGTTNGTSVVQIPLNLLPANLAGQITAIVLMRSSSLTIQGSGSPSSVWYSIDMADNLNNATVESVPLPAGTYSNFWFHWYPGITVNPGTNIWALFLTNNALAFTASMHMGGALDKSFFLSGASVTLATNGVPCTWIVTNDSVGTIAGNTMLHGSFTRIGP